jgi:hypothetical protein
MQTRKGNLGPRPSKRRAGVQKNTTSGERLGRRKGNDGQDASARKKSKLSLGMRKETLQAATDDCTDDADAELQSRTEGDLQTVDKEGAVSLDGQTNVENTRLDEGQAEGRRAVLDRARSNDAHGRYRNSRSNATGKSLKFLDSGEGDHGNDALNECTTNDRLAASLNCSPGVKDLESNGEAEAAKSATPEEGKGGENAIKECTLEMLNARAATSSICPSEVARAIGGAGWRNMMEDVRDVGRSLANAGFIRITQVGAALTQSAAEITTASRTWHRK